MAANAPVLPSEEYRKGIMRTGGESANRCYQCATCSSVCELAPDDSPFPRLQMLWAQWGLIDRVAADPSVWLCHQCNDCNVRCPRDAQPGDVMQSLRAMAVQYLAFPSFLGKLVGRAGSTWPILIGVPLLLWIVLIGIVNHGFHFPTIDPDRTFINGQYEYEHFVPHWLIYAVIFPIVGWVLMAAAVSGGRLWKMMGQGAERTGSFIGSLIQVVLDAVTHRRFDKCSGKSKRRWGHFFVMWGFVGAYITTSLAVVYLYIFDFYPFPLTHWVKWLGNTSSVILILGGLLLVINRLKADRQIGITSSFDRFFLGIVIAVIFSGVLTEVARFLWAPPVGCSIYLIHLTSISILFFTFPYSKFAHLLFRTLTLVHQRMTEDN